METIHFKTVDPLSQELLREAAKKGIELNWERFEKQQPQDGFLRLGLSCPYGCMQGPCRIDPFGRGADKGICGLDKDAMVAASLLRLTLQGALEAKAEAVAWDDESCSCQEECGADAPENEDEDEDEDECDGDEDDVAEAVRLLARPSASAETLVIQALRLGLMTVGLAEQGSPAGLEGSRKVRAGYGLLAGEAIRIALTGQVEEGLVAEILTEASEMKGPEVQLLSLGSWIPAGDDYLPLVCTAGEAELLLSSGKFNLLLTGEGADPAVLALGEKMKIPVVCDCEVTGEEIITMVREAFDHRIPALFAPDRALISEVVVSLGIDEVNAAMQARPAAKIALLGGADSMLQSLGHLPTELAKALRGADYSVASWGDAAIWMLKQDLPVAVLDDQNGPLAAILALNEANSINSLAGICFTGLRSCRDFSFALGLAALGLKVAVATPLPLGGSDEVRGLLKDLLAEEGGSLTYFDHPAPAEEILDWFLQS